MYIFSLYTVECTLHMYTRYISTHTCTYTHETETIISSICLAIKVFFFHLQKKLFPTIHTILYPSARWDQRHRWVSISCRHTAEVSIRLYRHMFTGLIWNFLKWAHWLIIALHHCHGNTIQRWIINTLWSTYVQQRSEKAENKPIFIL